MRRMSIWVGMMTRTTTLMTTSEYFGPKNVRLAHKISYSDSEDDSWRIRRTAAKLLQAIFGTRNELITNFYDNAAGTLIGRFNEREESVRLEVMDAFEALLKQTAISRNAELAVGSRNKRKRSHDMDEDGTDDRCVASTWVSGRVAIS